MKNFPLQVPTADATAIGDLARQLAALVGPAVQAPDGTAAACEYLALADAIQDARATTANAIAQSFADAVTDLLAETEDFYGVPSRPDATNATRQNVLLARIRGYAGTTQRVKLSLYPMIAATTTITETLIGGIGVARDIFRFDATMPTALYADTVVREAVNDQLQMMVPAHLNWSLTPV